MERLEDGEEAEKTLLAKLEDLINDRKSLSEKVESLESEINESRAQQALLEEQMQACKEASAELEQRANDTASYNEVLLEQSLARVKEMKALSATRQKLERQVQKLQSELAAKDPLSVLPSDRILHSPNATNSKLITRAVSSSPEGSASAASSSKRSAASSDAPLPPPKFVKNEALSAVFKMPATPAATAVPTEAAGPLRPSPGKAKGESAAAAESGPSQSSPPPRQAEQEPKRNARRRTIAASSALRSDQQQQQQPQSRTHPSKPECSQQ
ncbi:hypothetical protein DFJ73DRAFT_841696 [Zopfochytrium polystomum]|nr:hypothetical protein DFJ73DRAFT_841696 [Zopfochytrium polystomum]